MSSFKVLHNYWMNVLFDRHIEPHPVLGKEKPESTTGNFIYSIWSWLGFMFVMIAYPMGYFGIFTKLYFTDKIVNFVNKNSILEALLILGVAWVSLATISSIFYPTETTYAIIFSSVIAILSALVCYISYLTNNEKVKILVGYPTGYIAILLPPVIFSVLSPIFGDIIIDFSSEFTIFLKNQLARPLGLREFFSQNFSLDDFGHILLWTSISIVIGWITGVSVNIAKIILQD